MARIGNVEFVLIDEDRQYNSDITAHPVEKGVDIVDHVDLKPSVYSINGQITGPNAGNAHGALKALRDSKTITAYHGRSILYNCLIESYNTTVNVGIANGFSFSMTLREIKVAKPSTVALLPIALKVDVAEVGNAGRVQTQ